MRGTDSRRISVAMLTACGPLAAALVHQQTLVFHESARYSRRGDLLGDLLVPVGVMNTITLTIMKGSVMVTSTMDHPIVQLSSTSYTAIDDTQTKVNVTSNTGRSLADDPGLASALLSGLLSCLLGRKVPMRRRLRR